MKLKPSQKNQLFEVISASEIGAAMFRKEEFNDWTTETTKFIIHVNSQDFRFEISQSDNGKFHLEYSPGEEWIGEEIWVSNWNSVMDVFDKWLYLVNIEVNVVDKWAAFEKLLDETSLCNDTNIINDKFTVPEYLEIKEKIEFLKSGLLNLDINSSQLNLINEKLDLVLEQTKYLGKFDWRSFFVGTMMSVILQLSLSQEQGKGIWQLIKKFFTNYFLTF